MRGGSEGSNKSITSLVKGMLLRESDCSLLPRLIVRDSAKERTDYVMNLLRAHFRSCFDRIKIDGCKSGVCFQDVAYSRDNSVDANDHVDGKFSKPSICHDYNIHSYLSHINDSMIAAAWGASTTRHRLSIKIFLHPFSILS